MKRILALSLSLVLMIAALSGCTASQNREETQDSIDSTSPLFMTIAETLPSCVAFEYRYPDQAYCFYAYDADGKLYRVLWTDFEGLNEKDQITVEYSDIRELTYDNYPDGGWTPQYEITATNVTLSISCVYEATVVFRQYAWDGYGISTKTISFTSVGYSIIDALKAMKETGETVAKISDDVLDTDDDAFPGEFPVERGTMWIETDGSIYRLTPDLSQICRVETHFGEGRVLEMSDKFKTDVSNAWHYAPYDYYEGTYQSGDDTVELTHVYDAGSSVELRIKKIRIENEYDPQNTVTVELLTTFSHLVTIKLRCQHSDDNIASDDSKTLYLSKGVPDTVEFTFGGWKDTRYWVYIEADNTRAEITIEP